MTTLTIAEIVAKIQNNTATPEEVATLGNLYAKEQEKKKKWQEVFNKLIDTIENAKIDPKLLTKTLLDKSLIVLPKPQKAKKAKASDAKISFFETAIKTPSGRDGTFKIWKERDMAILVNDAKRYWTDIKAKGKEAFIAGLTAEGKAYYATAEGKTWVDGLFSTK
jgi:hypothetical protein